MTKQFILTSTNPCVGMIPDEPTSDSFERLIENAHRYAIGESNCDGCQHWYTISNRDTDGTFTLHSLELVCMYAKRYPWGVTNDGKTRLDNLSYPFLEEAAFALKCTVDELLYP